MRFIELKKNHFNQVLDISNRTLGNNYLTKEYLNQYLSSEMNLGYVIVKQEKVIGFTSITILTPTQLKDTVLKESKWFYEISKTHKNIALRKQTIVDPNSMNQGFGNKLVELSTKEVGKICDFQLSTVWKNEEAAIMGNLLIKNGFKLCKKIANYWSEDSSLKNYQCPICGNPPCKCVTEVYIKKNAPDTI